MKETLDLATQLGQQLLQKQLFCAVAESCTGGLLAAAITEVPGSSQWFERGFITYTNLAKQEILDVSPQILVEHGAVSEPCVRAMVAGALGASHAQVSIAISGIAGPTGGNKEKPVGTVWMAWGKRDTLQSKHFLFHGHRSNVREQAVVTALVEFSRFVRSFC